jgi:hypothetical protein
MMLQMSQLGMWETACFTSRLPPSTQLTTSHMHIVSAFGGLQHRAGQLDLFMQFRHRIPPPQQLPRDVL